MPNREIINIPVPFANNLNISVASDSTLSITAGSIRDSSNVFDITLDEAVTLDAEVVGANGIDTGALGNSSWYYVYAIGDTTLYRDPATLISLSATPYLPFGYDVLKRIGYARTDGSADFVELYQIGNSNMRQYFWDEMVTVLDAQGSATYADVDCAAAMAPGTRIANVRWLFVPATVTNTFALRPNGSASTGNIAGKSDVVSVPHRGYDQILTDTSRVAEYLTTSASDDLSLFVTSFYDFI